MDDVKLALFSVICPRLEVLDVDPSGWDDSSLKVILDRIGMFLEAHHVDEEEKKLPFQCLRSIRVDGGPKMMDMTETSSMIYIPTLRRFEISGLSIG